MSLFLAKGQSSNEVLALQDALNLSQPNQHQLMLDGIFGPNTEESVRRWQTANHLKLDGIAGPATLGSLFEGIDIDDRMTMHIHRSLPDQIQQPGQPAQTPTPFSPGAVGVLWDLGALKSSLEVRRRAISAWDVFGVPKPRLDVPAFPQFLPGQDRTQRPDVRLGDGSVTIVRPLQESGLSVAGELSIGWAGDRTLESSLKGKLIVPLARKRLRLNQSEPWRFEHPSLTLAAGGKGTHDGSKDKTAVHFTGQVTLTPFTVKREEWGKLGGRTSFSVAPQLVTSYILSQANKHKVAFGASLRPEFTFRRAGSRLYVGLGAEVGIFGYLAISPDKFQVGYFPYIGPFLTIKGKF